MQRFLSNGKGDMMRSVALSLIFSTLFIGISVGAATTISTSITTDGTLSVTGASTLTGLTTMVYASSTGQSLTGNLTVGGRATTTGSSGNIETAGTLTAVGASTLNGAVTLGDAAGDAIIVTGNASTTNSFEVGNDLYVNGYATTTGSNGDFATRGTLTITGASVLNGAVTLGDAAGDAIIVTGNASTTNSFEVGNDLYVNGMSTTTGSSGNIELRGGLTVGNATANSLAGTILFSAQTSDPTGVTQGTVYYNSTSKVLRLFDGTDWFTTGTTSSGLLLSTNRIQLDNLALRHLALGTTTQQGIGKSLVTLEATTTASIPLSIVGFSGQTGHLLDVLNGTNVAGPKLLFIDSSGGLFGSSTAAFGSTLTVGGILTATTSAYLATTAGTVGVGTTTPGATFSVQGNGLVSGTLSTAAFIATSSTVTLSGLGIDLLTSIDSSGNLISTSTPTAARYLATSSIASFFPYASSTSFSTSVASTTNLTLGAGSTLAGMIFGTCDIAQTSITASTTAFRNCAAATGITTAYKVFVQATSSLATGVTVPVGAGAGFVIVSASSTAVNTISVEISNLTGGNNTPSGTLNFWAVR